MPQLEACVANGQTPVPGVPVRFAGSFPEAAPWARRLFRRVQMASRAFAGSSGTGGNQRVEAEILTGANRFQHRLQRQLRSDRRRRSCDLTAGPTATSALTTNDLRPPRAEIWASCPRLLPGDHVVEGLNLDVGGFLTIHGCGPGTTIQLSGPASFTAMSYFELAGVTAAPGVTRGRPAVHQMPGSRVAQR